jgi:hypothetical protein
MGDTNPDPYYQNESEAVKACPYTTFEEAMFYPDIKKGRCISFLLAQQDVFITSGLMKSSQRGTLSVCKVMDGKTKGLGGRIAGYNSVLGLLKRQLNTRFNQSGVRKAEAVARHDTFQYLTPASSSSLVLLLTNMCRSESLENETSHIFEALLRKYPNLGNTVIELKRIQSVLIAREHIGKRYDGLVVYTQHPIDGETYFKMVAEYNAGIWYLIFKTMGEAQVRNAEKNDPYDADQSDLNSINTQDLMR